MNDRELLELAARAAGLSGWVYESAINGMVLLISQQQRGTPYWISYEGVFRPLTDDGDALRLAVLLQIGVDHCDNGVDAWMPDGDGNILASAGEPCTDETRLEATRRAITRCAAGYQLRKDNQK